MKFNFKNINIGELIKERVLELEIPISRICIFLNCTEQDIKKMYSSRGLDSEIILRWCKLLKYDFFRIYSHHLLLYAPPSKSAEKESAKDTVREELPQFRKNIYTKQVIDFILEKINNGEKSKQQVIDEYRIPKTTLYKWINKYQKPDQ